MSPFLPVSLEVKPWLTFQEEPASILGRRVVILFLRNSKLLVVFFSLLVLKALASGNDLIRRLRFIT